MGDFQRENEQLQMLREMSTAYLSHMMLQTHFTPQRESWIEQQMLVLANQARKVMTLQGEGA